MIRPVDGKLARLNDIDSKTLFAGAFAAYALLALSAYELFGALTIGVTFFPPAGLTFACLLTLNLGRWPVALVAFAAGEVLINVVEHQPLGWSLGWAAANTAEPMVGAAVARAMTQSIALDRRFAKAFAAGGALVGPAVGASIGATVLSVSNGFGWWDGWSDIWVGDALGVVVVAPAVILMLLPAEYLMRPPRQLIVAGVLVVAALCSAFFLTERAPLGYAAIPVLGWAALMLGARGLALTSVAIASAATAATAHGYGPWSATDEFDAHEQLSRQQFFLVVAIGSAWLLALEVRRRTTAVARAAAAERDLQQALLRASLVDEMQRVFLPDKLLDNEHVTVAGHYQPANHEIEIGGDWFDMWVAPDGVIELVVGDVVGHGVEAAAIMGQLSSASRAIAMSTGEPRLVIELLDQLAARIPGARCSAMVCARFDPATATLTYSRAGHPPPLVRFPDGRVQILDDATGPPLTFTDTPRPQATVALVPGSVVVMYSDGLIDERHSASRRDPIIALAEHLGQERSSDPHSITESLLEHAIGARTLADDVAVLCLVVRQPISTA
jgi:serine phosphatase RsbU (regulator of sigma subunit)